MFYFTVMQALQMKLGFLAFRYIQINFLFCQAYTNTKGTLCANFKMKAITGDK